MLKILFWDGNGLCLFTKRLDQGGFIWPSDERSTAATVTLFSSAARHADEGIDWRSPERVWKPALAG